MTTTTNWSLFLNKEKEKPYFQELWSFLEKQYQQKNIFPKKEQIFRCFEYFNVEQLKVVIVGQDPYYVKGYANGLAFAVNNDCKTPKSLINIFKEIQNEFHYQNSNKTLTNWAKQGVLLLNKTLTVEENKPNSHANIGWQYFLNNLINYLNNLPQTIVFTLWGNQAQQLKPFINTKKHKIVCCAHPSPLSANKGFFNSNCFIKINSFLKQPIKW